MSRHPSTPGDGRPRRAPTATAWALLALLVGSPGATGADSTPAWSPLDSLAVEPAFPGVLGNPRILVDGAGRLRIIAAEFADSSQKATLGWRAWDWRNGHFVAGPRLPARGAFLPPDPVATDDSLTRVLWLGHDIDRDGRGRVLTADLAGDAFTTPDTILATWPQASELAGAIGPRREWVVRSEQRFPQATTFAVRVLTRPRGAPVGWHELPDLGTDEFGCGAAPLAGDSVLVVHAGASGLAFAVGGATGWGRRGTLDPRPWRAMHPRLRPDGAGGAWLLWTDKEHARVARWTGGGWSERDSLSAEHAPGETFWSAWCDLDRTPGAGRPILAWGDRGYGSTMRDVLCVAWPTATGWTAGQVVPGSEGAIVPTLARDATGATWIAWSLPDRPGVFYTRRAPAE